MNLQGQLLVALPHLHDPNFRGSVVLVMEHGEEGSLGLVLNRATRVLVSALTRDLGVEWQGSHGDAVGRGGPVQPEMVWLLHAAGGDIPGSTKVMDGCWYCVSMDGMLALAPLEGARRRIFFGYAGWGAGQLEDELREGVWLPVDSAIELVFDASAADLWERALRRIGIEPAALVAPNGLVH